MTRLATGDQGLGKTLAISLAIHLAALWLAGSQHLLRPDSFPAAPVYYVDVINLPVSDPQAGVPAAGIPAPTPPEPATMAAPAPQRAAPVPKQSPAAQRPPDDDTPPGDFQDRLANLEKKVAQRRQEGVLDNLRQKVASGGSERRGTPGGTGNQAGSDYATYIHSRLRDEFILPESITDPRLEVVVLLLISPSGRVAKTVIEKKSGNRLFDDAVSWAIIRAEKRFPPPPDARQFERRFSFRPQGVATP